MQKNKEEREREGSKEKLFLKSKRQQDSEGGTESETEKRE